MICHAGSVEAKLWFGNKLKPKLSKDIKSLIVVNNAKYYCRLMEKTPSMKMRKNCMTEFMKERNITIPEPILTKPVLLNLIREERYSEAIYCLQHRQNFKLFSSPGATRSLYVKPYTNGLEPDEATLSATKHLGN